MSCKISHSLACELSTYVYHKEGQPAGGVTLNSVAGTSQRPAAPTLTLTILLVMYWMATVRGVMSGPSCGRVEATLLRLPVWTEPVYAKSVVVSYARPLTDNTSETRQQYHWLAIQSYSLGQLVNSQFISSAEGCSRNSRGLLTCLPNACSPPDRLNELSPPLG